MPFAIHVYQYYILLTKVLSRFCKVCKFIQGDLGHGETRKITCNKPTIGSFVFIIFAHSPKKVLALCEVDIDGVLGKKHYYCFNL